MAKEYLRNTMEKIIKEDLSNGFRDKKCKEYGRYQVVPEDDIAKFIEKHSNRIDDAVHQFIEDNLCELGLVREYLYEFVDTGMFKYRDLALERELKKYK